MVACLAGLKACYWDSCLAPTTVEMMVRTLEMVQGTHQKMDMTMAGRRVLKKARLMAHLMALMIRSACSKAGCLAGSRAQCSPACLDLMRTWKMVPTTKTAWMMAEMMVQKKDG